MESGVDDINIRERNLIGLTGGIGAGKSVVARILRCKGFAVYDCDYIAGRLMQESEQIRIDLIGCFGDSCYLSDGSLDRRYLAQRIFSSDEDRMTMNRIVHAAVRDDVVRMAREKGKNEELLFVESAILHTSMLDRYCNCVWHVDAPEEVRFARAMSRGGIEPDNLRARMNSQKDEFRYIHCRKILEIDNSDNVSLLPQIDMILKETLESV